MGGGYFSRTVNIFKKNYKFLIGLVVGLGISIGGVYAATAIAGSGVTYSNSSSGLTSTTVQGAIDELYTKTDIRNSGNFVSAYKYSTATSTKCITGEESTCVKSTCYKTKTKGSCSAGTIIKYKVNDTDIMAFHVMFDNGSTLTMQSQKNVLYNREWITQADYNISNTDGTSCGYYSCNDEGPRTVLADLETSTAGWTNANVQSFTLGTTTFKTNAYTGCSTYNSCSTNTYTLSTMTRARLITLQEAKALGCTTTAKSCPIWMYNYLSSSVDNGGTVDDKNFGPRGTTNNGYYTMSAYSSSTNMVWSVNYFGFVGNSNVYSNGAGVRAVVTVSK